MFRDRLMNQDPFLELMRGPIRWVEAPTAGEHDLETAMAVNIEVQSLDLFHLVS